MKNRYLKYKNPELLGDMKYLTYDDLADFYDKKTGGTARIQPVDKIYEWATKQEEIQINEDTSLSFKIKEK